MLDVVSRHTHQKTLTVAGQQLQQSPSPAKLFPCLRGGKKIQRQEKLLVVLPLFLSLTFSFSLGLLGDGVPKEPSVAAAALKQTSQQVKPSTNTTLFAEQQWSFVACLIVDSKL